MVFVKGEPRLLRRGRAGQRPLGELAFGAAGHQIQVIYGRVVGLVQAGREDHALESAKSETGEIRTRHHLAV